MAQACGLCKKTNPEIKRTISCSKCKVKFCNVCGQTQDSYMDILARSDWNCPPCKTSMELKVKAYDDLKIEGLATKLEISDWKNEIAIKMDSISTENQQLRTDFIDLKGRVDDLEMKLNSQPENSSAAPLVSQDSIAQQVVKEVMAQKSIENNIIIKKMKVTGSTDLDLNVNAKIMATEFLTKLGIEKVPSSLTAIIPKDKSRGIMVKVRLDNNSDKGIIFTAMKNKKLDNTGFETISITSDFTYDQRQARKIIWDQWKQRKDAGEDVIISRNRVIVKSTAQVKNK